MWKLKPEFAKTEKEKKYVEKAVKRYEKEYNLSKEDAKDLAVLLYGEAP